MILLELFLGFLEVGCFSFGGAYAAIPLIKDVVTRYGWLDDEMLAYMIGVSESTPGPLMVNIATYVGTVRAGILGAIVATFAVVLPAFFIVLAISAILSKVINNKYVKATLDGIKSCVVGIIFAIGSSMIVRNLCDSNQDLDYKAAVITTILAVLYFGFPYITKKRFSPIMLIAISAILGIAGYSF